MSFDLFYQPCRFGTQPVEQKNPFTGEIQTSLPVEPLSAEDVRAIQAILAGAGARGPTSSGVSWSNCVASEQQTKSQVERIRNALRDRALDDSVDIL